MASLPARRWADAAIVLLAIAAQVDVWTSDTQTPHAVTAPAALLWTLPLLWRRRYPLGAPVLVFATLAAEAFLPGDVTTESSVNAFALIGTFCVAGTHPDPRYALLGGGAGFVAISSIVLNDADESTRQTAVAIFCLGAAAWALGRALAERGRRAEVLEARAERVEREHEAAVLSERARIAGELHDVIAHSVSVMTIQAGAARLMLDEDPQRAREPLEAVEETGHQALGEMRRLLGILRGGDEGERAPQPGLAHLDALMEQVRSAGLPVELVREGTWKPVSPGVDLAAFRIVQEALTNVLKHAPGASASVLLRYAGGQLELEVTNGAGDRNGAGAESGGYGLIGMRQRVALYGGELESGPRPDGGYRVAARIPLAEEEP